jgi:lipoyl-dependent peroxiredoxin
MAMAERTAQCVWKGDLAHGNGLVTSGSGALGELPVTWASRTQRSEGKTSPEELIAAAHCSCFSMALSNGLTTDGHAPERLDVTALVTLDLVDGAPTITSSHLTVTGRVPGLDQAGFEAATGDAAKNCPVSRALGSVNITHEATLEA